VNKGFSRALEFVLRHEGAYVNDPQDPGGETNMGISKRAYPALDIANLTRNQAAAIYRADYWDRMQCDKFPEPLAIILFDSGVNQGTNAAVKMLQKALRVTQDGIIGPMTIGAAQGADIKGMVAQFAAERGYRYGSTLNFERFGRGWMRRLIECVQEAT